MLALISPAKKMNKISGIGHRISVSTPLFMAQTQELAQHLKSFSQKEIQTLMGLSENLATLNHQRYGTFETTKETGPAAFLFAGDTYVGLDAATLSEEALDYGQDHLRILSGLYGLLRPLDPIKPHRLEMRTKLNTKAGHDLYSFWGNDLTQSCIEAVKTHKDPTIVFLASNEYNKAIQLKHLSVPFVTCHFKENRPGGPKTIGLFAKKARGMMARHMIQQRVNVVEGLKDFKAEGYIFTPHLSTKTDLIFVR